MGQILHKRARTTQVIRQEIKDAQGSLQKVAKHFNLNPKTIEKWKKRESTEDLPMGNGRQNSVLTPEEDTLICQVRQKTWLPLDDLLDHLQPLIPKLTRSNLHRCLQYYGISRVPEAVQMETQVKKRGKFRSYEIGYIHLDITEFYLCQKKYYLFVSIDRITKLAFAKLYDRKRIEETLDFTEQAIRFYPYKIHRLLTDNGQQFTYRSMPKDKRPRHDDNTPKRHPFSTLLREHGIKHKLTRFFSPQTNGQVEKMNDIIKSATIKLFHYCTVDQFRLNLDDFLNYYNCSKKLNALKRQTPYEFTLQKWQQNPKLFHRDPNHHCVGLDT